MPALSRVERCLPDGFACGADPGERIKKPAGYLHRDDLPVQFGFSHAAANGAAGRNARVSACYCTSLWMTQANPKNDPSAENRKIKAGVGIFNPTT